MTTKTTPEQARAFKAELEILFQGQPWFKNIANENDDHGDAVGLFVNKEQMQNAGFSVPVQHKVKVLVYNKA